MTSGVRLGPSADIIRSISEADFRKVGKLVPRVIDALSATPDGKAEIEAEFLSQVRAMCNAHPDYG